MLLPGRKKSSLCTAHHRCFPLPKQVYSSFLKHTHILPFVKCPSPYIFQLKNSYTCLAKVIFLMWNLLEPKRTALVLYILTIYNLPLHSLVFVCFLDSDILEVRTEIILSSFMFLVTVLILTKCHLLNIFRWTKFGNPLFRGNRWHQKQWTIQSKE